ncbi:EAL domain-containing protein [Ancylothrix sp. C2]|uniref:EAL domain-containing protein n=1 Tax=Ancylothrix sp. D3o TaxID=2953691 RepID=UPI0021BAA909|nr:EAL domain-containing protein [Ancylothrix sp. D3o]MCT7949835.1 EAL domain-containing protein [Ancylothrix sp. D3o]
MSHINKAGQRVGQHNPDNNICGEYPDPLPAVLDQASDGLLSVDINPDQIAESCGGSIFEFHIVRANPASRLSQGFSNPQPLMELPLQEGWPALLAQIIVSQLKHCLEQEKLISSALANNCNLPMDLMPVNHYPANIERIIALCKNLHALSETETDGQQETRKLSHLINCLPGIVFSCTNPPDWEMTYLSEGCYKLTGYTSQELTGKNRTTTYDDLTHPADLETVIQAIKKAITNKQPYVVEYRIFTKDGQEKWLWEKGSGVFDSYGNILALEGFISDITERKLAEEAKKASDRVLESMVEGVILWDKDGIMTYTNPAFDAMFGYKNSEVIGQHISILSAYPMSENQKIISEINQKLNEQGKWLGEFNNRKKDGSLFTTYAHISTLEMAEKKHICCVCEDISDRKRAEIALREAEKKYRSIFENAVEGIFQTTLDGSYLTANPMLARIYGYESPGELMSSIRNIEQQLYVDPKRRAEFTRILQENDAVLEFESEVYRKDKSKIWISENARAIRGPNRQLLGYEGTVIDITRRKQAEAELLKRDSLLEAVAAAMTHLLTESNHRSAIVNALATLGNAAFVDRVYICENHTHPDTGQAAMSIRFEWCRSDISSTIDQPSRQNLSYNSTGLQEWYDILKTGQPIAGTITDFSLEVQPLLEANQVISLLMVPVLLNNEFWGYIGFDDCHSIRSWSKSELSILVAIAASIGGAVQRHRTLASIHHQAYHDRLTGLPNRQLLDTQLPVALETANSTGHKLAVMFLDLDRFKIINDTLGHAVGDQLLQCAAQRLRNCLRDQDIIVRWGGDEFILLLPNLNSAEDASSIAQRILEALRPAFDIEQNQLHITSSIGIALYPHDGEDAETLIKNADIALYRAKEEGRNNYQIYTAGMNSCACDFLQIGNNLYDALEQGEFLLHYQPQFNTASGKITAMEALLRWQHPQRGVIFPETFIPLAEDNGTIFSLGRWVLQTAALQAKTWLDLGLSPVRVAVNISSRQFTQPAFVEIVKNILHSTGLPAAYLQLEISETIATQNVAYTGQAFQQLSRLGVHICIDHFGAGYASLKSLKHFDFHSLKIDRSFIADLNDNPQDAAIVTALLNLANALNINVIAEGIETEQNRHLLQKLGCQEMQGYLFQRPLATDQATNFLKDFY